MRISILTRLIPILVVCLAAGVRAADDSAPVNTNNVSVRSTPSNQAEILLTIDKGTRVQVVRQQGAWLKVKVTLDPTFSVDGWILAKSVDWKPRVKAPPVVAKKTPSPVRAVRTPAPVPPRSVATLPRVRTTPRPTPIPFQPFLSTPPRPVPTAVPPVAKSNPALDQFFFDTPTPAPTSTPIPMIAAPPLARRETPRVIETPVPREPEPRSLVRDTFENPPPRSERNPEMEIPPERSSPFSLSVAGAYELYQYQLTSVAPTAGQVFSYNLPGFGVQLDARGWVWQSASGVFSVGAAGSYRHTFYRFDTNLKDDTGNTFDSQSMSFTSGDFDGRVLSRYRFPMSGRSGYISGEAGYRYTKLSADDVESINGPMFLFLSQTVTNFVVGAHADLPIPGAEKFRGGIGVDALLLGSIKEEPEDATGRNGDAGLGLMPSLFVRWEATERHHLDFGYNLRMQSFSFEGTASRVGSSNVNNGEVKTMSHQLVVQYGYAF